MVAAGRFGIHCRTFGNEKVTWCRRCARALVAIPAHEGADEESDGESNSSSCIRALFYRRAQKVVSLSRTLARSLERIGCRVLRLAIEVLGSSFQLCSLALQLGFRVAGRAPEFFSAPPNAVVLPGRTRANRLSFRGQDLGQRVCRQFPRLDLCLTITPFSNLGGQARLFGQVPSKRAAFAAAHRVARITPNS